MHSQVIVMHLAAEALQAAARKSPLEAGVTRKGFLPVGGELRLGPERRDVHSLGVLTVQVRVAGQAPGWQLSGRDQSLAEMKAGRLPVDRTNAFRGPFIH